MAPFLLLAACVAPDLVIRRPPPFVSDTGGGEPEVPVDSAALADTGGERPHSGLGPGPCPPDMVDAELACVDR